MNIIVNFCFRVIHFDSNKLLSIETHSSKEKNQPQTITLYLTINRFIVYLSNMYYKAHLTIHYVTHPFT